MDEISRDVILRWVLDGYSTLQQLQADSKVPQVNLNQTSTAHFYIE